MLNLYLLKLEVYKMTLKPLADRVVLKQNAAEERTSSGIFLTASAQEKPEVYEVVEVGPGGMVDGNEVKMIVKAGQNVLVGKYSGTKVKLDDVEYTIVRQSDILAVIE
jgi:chaperonin GroES